MPWKRGLRARNECVSKNETLPSSARAARRRPSALSASSRTRVPPPWRTASAAGLRSSEARRLLRVAAVSSSATPSRARSSARSSLGSDSACAPRRCAIAAVACRFALPRAASATPPATSAASSRTTAAASSARSRRVARACAMRLASRNSRSRSVQPGAVRRRVRPLERRREARAAVELARLPPATPPTPRPPASDVGAGGGPARPPRATAEPRPLLEQRLVHELDRAVVGDEEPPLDENRRARARRAARRSASSSARGDTPARQRLAATAADEPEQDPARRPAALPREATGTQPRRGGRRRRGHRRSARTRRASAASRSRSRQRSTSAVESSGSPPGSPATSSTSCVDERRLDLEAGPLGGSLDRAAELGRRHRPEQDVVRADEIGELDVRREMAEEVGAQARSGRARGARDPRQRRRARR